MEEENEYDDGWSDGYDIGYRSGMIDGIDAQKQNIEQRMALYIDTMMANNKFREVKIAKELLPFLTWEYDKDDAERRMRQEEENSDGFGLIL